MAFYKFTQTGAEVQSIFNDIQKIQNDTSHTATDIGAVGSWIKYFLDNKANLSGGNTFSGNQTFQGGASITTEGYVKGTWLQTTGNVALGSTPGLYAVVNNGWIYTRTLAQTKTDLGLGTQVTYSYSSGTLTITTK